MALATRWSKSVSTAVPLFLLHFMVHILLQCVVLFNGSCLSYFCTEVIKYEWLVFTSGEVDILLSDDPYSVLYTQGFRCEVVEDYCPSCNGHENSGV